MLPLANKPNAAAPSGAEPFGDINDNTGTGNGVPVNRLVYHDLNVFAETLMYTANTSTSQDCGNMAISAAPANGQLDSGALNGVTPGLLPSSYQLICAFFKNIVLTIENFIANQTTVNAGLDDQRYITSLKLANRSVPWTLINLTSANVTGTYSGAGSPGSIGSISGTMKYIITNSKTLTINFNLSFAVAGQIDTIKILLPASKLWSTTTNVGLLIFCAPGVGATGFVLMNANNTDTSHLVIAGTAGGNYSTGNNTMTGSITAEIQ
jgi:hypothetical protein